MKDSHAATADLAVHGCQRRDCEVGDTVREVLLRVEVPNQKLVRWEMLVLAICMLAHVACLGGRARCRRSLLGFALTLGGSLGRCRSLWWCLGCWRSLRRYLGCCRLGLSCRSVRSFGCLGLLLGLRGA